MTDQSPARRVAIFDLDGVISDASARQHYLASTPQDWLGFNQAAADDPPLAAGVALLQSLADDYEVVIITARPAWTRQLTLDWLTAHEIRHDELVLRPDGDTRSTPDFKRAELERVQAEGADVGLAFEDHLANVSMYRSAGVETFYVHSGYYDAG